MVEYLELYTDGIQNEKYKTNQTFFCSSDLSSNNIHLNTLTAFSVKSEIISPVSLL